MNEIFLFLKRNPWVLVIVLVWIANGVGNIVKATKKARERAQQAQRPQRVEPSAASRADARAEPRGGPAGAPRPIRADEIAAEMRRILRGQPEAKERERAAPEADAGDVVSVPERAVRQPSPPPLPSAQPGPRQALPATVRARNVALPERAPQPVVPTTSSRRLQIHVDPHVGENISRRVSVRSGHVGEHTLGQLGGRMHGHAGRRTAGNRYSLEDLKRVIVMNEILGPPLALRGTGGREI